MSYSERLRAVVSPKFDSIIEIAKELVPQARKEKPWVGLNHGTNVYTNESDLNCYLAAYGVMHQEKVKLALTYLSSGKINKPLEIIDWGCGQGLASACFIDDLKAKNKIKFLKKVTLIEPSKIALDRAVLNLAALLRKENVSIEDKNVYLPQQGEQNEPVLKEIRTRQPLVIHLFSNILDVECLDIKKIAELASEQEGENIYLCMGPCNSREDRILYFARYFEGSDDFQIKYKKNPRYGYLSDGHPYSACVAVFSCQLKAYSRLVHPLTQPYPRQLFAGYLLDCMRGEADIVPDEYAVNVYAPFAFENVFYEEEKNPILSVLSNIVSRGLPTKASPFVENVFKKVFKVSEANTELGSLTFPRKKGIEISSHLEQLLIASPVEIAWIQKLILELMLTGILSFSADTDKWKVLVVEEDFPCAALAFEDLRQMFSHITSLSSKFDDVMFPEIELDIVSEYPESPLHLGHRVCKADDATLIKKIFDVVINVSFMRKENRSGYVFPKFKARNDCYFYLRKASECFAKRLIYTSERIQYKPLGSNDAQGIFSPNEDNVSLLKYFLQLLFRKVNFREGQLPILNRAIQLKTVIGLLPTGGGKSLTYQLASMLQPGVTIVIDPINSLMHDQYNSLIRNGFDSCTYINAQVDSNEKERRENSMALSELQIVFLSPERLAIRKFRSLLANMENSNVYFAYGVIDEVHCVSEWGHDFRTIYLHLGRNLYNYVRPKEVKGQDKCISLFGLTATASFDVLSDVERELSGVNSYQLPADATVRFENVNRLELQYKVVKVHPGFNEWKTAEKKNSYVPQVIRELWRDLKELSRPESISFMKNRFIERENIVDENKKEKILQAELIPTLSSDWLTNEKESSSLIVFCPHRKGSLGVNDNKYGIGVSGRLKHELKGIRLSTYIGRGKDEDRGDKEEDVMVEQDKFLSGQTNVMVATKAFGLGIDKPNVRFTINMNHSGSLEAFVQEAGRAGRDHKLALAVILYSGVPKFSRTSRAHENPVKSHDYEVHDYFHGNSFKGQEYEKCYMNYVLNNAIFTFLNGQRVSGLEGVLNQLKNSDPVEVETSYDPNQDEVQKLFALIKRKFNRTVLDDDFFGDLSKAIYRMTCIGIVEDTTIDYKRKTIQLKVKKKSDKEYYDNLKIFLTRYYNEERSEVEIRRAKVMRGNNELQRCLSFLTDFIYSKIASKRKQAIEDMDLFCSQAVDSPKNWIETNEDLKDFIYYYFNSKYAREGYTAPNGESFSLTEDTDRGKEWSWDLIFKYMRVIDDDLVASESPKDNILHLQGAVRLIRRALTEINPTLNLLNVYCLEYLKTENTPLLRKEMDNNFKEGYLSLYKESRSKDAFYANIERFKNGMTVDHRNILSEKEVEHLDDLQLECQMQIHKEWITKFLGSFNR